MPGWEGVHTGWAGGAPGLVLIHMQEQHASSQTSYLCAQPTGVRVVRCWRCCRRQGLHVKTPQVAEAGLHSVRIFASDRSAMSCPSERAAGRQLRHHGLNQACMDANRALMLRGLLGFLATKQSERALTGLCPAGRRPTELQALAGVTCGV